jgi:hypothetical protein
MKFNFKYFIQPFEQKRLLEPTTYIVHSVKNAYTNSNKEHMK